MLRWIRSYGLMVKWVFLSYRPWLSLLFAVQLAIAVGMIYGISYLYPVMTPDIAKYLITGAPTIILLMIGFVVIPQIVAGARLEGTFDYTWSLPIPRMTHIAADATVMFGAILPGVILSVILGAIHFDFSLHATFLVIPAVLLIGMCGSFVGYSMAFAVPKPMMVNVITQIFSFAIMLFSPVMFPAERLPGWLQAIHQVLPIQYMADLVRGTLTDIPVNMGKAFIITGAWTAACLILTNLLVRRRT